MSGITRSLLVDTRDIQEVNICKDVRSCLLDDELVFDRWDATSTIQPSAESLCLSDESLESRRCIS